jgi:hypothetical protein
VAGDRRSEGGVEGRRLEGMSVIRFLAECPSWCTWPGTWTRQMKISTRNLEGLPDVMRLKRLLQSMAMLDAILTPEWQHRYYSFNAHWGEGEMMGSMRDGSGDEFFALFNSHGVFLKGFAHDSAAAAERIPSELFYRELPGQLEQYRREPAFSTDSVTFCIWRLIGEPTWSYGKVDLPASDDADGSARLLSMLDGDPDTYRLWASEYCECDVPIGAIEAVYGHQALSDELVIALNPQQSVKLLGPDIAQIGYSARQT